MKKAKSQGKYVVATGCYATTDFEILRDYDYVDLVVQNDNKLNLSEYLDDRPADTADRTPGCYPLVSSFERTRAFIKIQDGCDRFCSYCKIPYARGRSRSFALDDILHQIERLISSGFKEVVLTGVNISDYRQDDIRLSALVGEILTIPGDYRLRLSSLQPDQFEESLLSYLDHPRFARHFHLSLQSGSTGVLQRMNRHYTADEFSRLVGRIRQSAPDCGITTDIIVGFSGETEQEFNETCELCENIGFSRIHVFPYSPRQGTRAARWPDIDSAVKKQRESRLISIAQQGARDFCSQHMLGREHQILVETWQDEAWTGYTSNYLRMNSRTPGLRENSFAVLQASRSEVSPEGVISLFDF